MEPPRSGERAECTPRSLQEPGPMMGISRAYHLSLRDTGKSFESTAGQNCEILSLPPAQARASLRRPPRSRMEASALLTFPVTFFASLLPPATRHREAWSFLTGDKLRLVTIFHSLYLININNHTTMILRDILTVQVHKLSDLPCMILLLSQNSPIR